MHCCRLLCYVVARERRPNLVVVLPYSDLEHNLHPNQCHSAPEYPSPRSGSGWWYLLPLLGGPSGSIELLPLTEHCQTWMLIARPHFPSVTHTHTRTRTRTRTRATGSWQTPSCHKRGVTCAIVSQSWLDDVSSRVDQWRESAHAQSKTARHMACKRSAVLENDRCRCSVCMEARHDAGLMLHHRCMCKTLALRIPRESLLKLLEYQVWCHLAVATGGLCAAVPMPFCD